MAKAYSLWVLLLYFPLSACLVMLSFKHLVYFETVMGVSLPRTASKEAALRLAPVAAAPLLVIGLVERITQKSTVFLERLRQTIMEQTLLFVGSLLAAATTEVLNTGQLTMLTGMFCLSQVLYTLTFVIGSRLRFPPATAVASMFSYSLSGFLLLILLRTYSNSLSMNYIGS